MTEPAGAVGPYLAALQRTLEAAAARAPADGVPVQAAVVEKGVRNLVASLHELEPPAGWHDEHARIVRSAAAFAETDLPAPSLGLEWLDALRAMRARAQSVGLDFLPSLTADIMDRPGDDLELGPGRQ
ncbi:MAG: hypothetical protein IT303_07335 [Dehalococcoidia bacterium]|nr:hypothetical protein [Dehalococcoidia bacterium]